MNKYVIEVDEKQLKVINEALDMYSRMGTGQLEVSVTEFIRMNFWDSIEKIPDNRDTNTYIKNYIEYPVNIIKERVLGHPPNGSYSIYNEAVPQKCREAYDLYQVFRKEVTQNRIKELESQNNLEGAKWVKGTVSMRDYYPTNPDWPKAKISTGVETNND